MKGHTEIRDLSRLEDREAVVRGWLYARRESGKIRFLVVRDGTGYLQCVAVAKEVSPEVFALCGALGQESSLEARGTIRREPRAPGGYEMGLKDLKVLHAAQEYPITPKEHGVEFLMDNRHLWLRSQRQHAIMTVRAGLIRFVRDFFDNRGFLCIDTPVFTPNACEGTTTLFETDYFGDKAYLTQSGQLYNEANAAAFRKVYCFGPTFRAEKSKTRRHLIEFWMVEPEVAFAGLDDIIELAEEMIVEIVGRCLERYRPLLAGVLERDVAKLERVQRPFPRISYDEAAAILKRKGAAFEPGSDFGAADETILSEEYDRPLFVHRFPSAIKAFYMAPDPEDPARSLSVDLLASEGYGEIVGGGERIHDLALLERRIEEHGLPKKAFQWYLDLRRYGTFPHAGFGLGIERTLSYVCGLQHVRETIPYPRLLNRLSP